MNIQLKTLYNNNFISFGHKKDHKGDREFHPGMFSVDRPSYQKRLEGQIKDHFEKGKPITEELLMLIDDWAIENERRYKKQHKNTRQHIHGRSTANTIGEIAKIVGYLYPLKANLAGRLHDCAGPEEEKMKEQFFSEQNESEIKAKFKKHGITFQPGEWEKMEVHGPLGKIKVKEKLGITDPEILDAIRYHSIGPKPESKNILAKILYIADKIDPFKRYSDIYNEIIVKLKKTKNLDAVIEFIKKK